MGAYFNGTTDVERVNYFFTFDKDSLASGLKFMNAALRFPIYRTEDMQKERPVVDGEFQRAESDPGFQLWIETQKRTWGENFTRKNPIGEHDVINTATPEKMMVIKDKYYLPNNSILVICGDVEHTKAFALAQQIYELLVNGFAKHPDILYAHLALAASHNAQASADLSASGQLSNHAEIALGIYERLVDQADAGTELRIEAGYNLGLLHSRRSRPEGLARAEVVWWKQVVTPFLLDENRASSLPGTGQHWMSRTLLGLGELLEGQGKLEQAREVYLLLLRKGLPGETIAKDRLARFGVKVPQ
jgi:hypothetical protein